MIQTADRVRLVFCKIGFYYIRVAVLDLRACTVVFNVGALKVF
jgi:hypothetical protein